MPQFAPVISTADLSWKQAWVKYDATHLFFGFQIRDDIAYGTDTPYWAPAGNPNAGLLNQTGWPCTSTFAKSAHPLLLLGRVVHAVIS
jgi:hypothetical protein